MISDDLDDELNDSDLDIEPIDINIIKEKIPHHHSKKLCDIIVCDRYFGSYKEIAIMCMEELSKRRLAGDNFDFETYIDKAYGELPQIELSIPDLGDVLKQIVSRKFK